MTEWLKIERGMASGSDIVKTELIPLDKIRNIEIEENKQSRIPRRYQVTFNFDQYHRDGEFKIRMLLTILEMHELFKKLASPNTLGNNNEQQG